MLLTKPFVARFADEQAFPHRKPSPADPELSSPLRLAGYPPPAKTRYRHAPAAASASAGISCCLTTIFATAVMRCDGRFAG
ncbi:hypothetical protein KCP78_07305 [Salmonella enterica subsp. enterica]|nr:hypothetical protein KCP78_07305 [Salmonella enterica subsp. enterica]